MNQSPSSILNMRVLQTINFPSEKVWNERLDIVYGRKPMKNNKNIWPLNKYSFISNGRVGE